MSIYQGDDKIKHIEVPTSGRNIDHFLPSAYQEVEYIESSGTQYIDTGVPSGDMTVTMDVQGLTTPSETKCYFVVGSSALSGGSYFGTSGGVYSLGSDTSKTTIASTDRVTIINNFVKNVSFGYDAMMTVNNGISEQYVSRQSGAENSGFANIFCFNLPFRPIAKLYSCKIEQNNTLVRNFIPAKRKSDNEVGLYDTVNNQFYTNQGTGSFTAGPNIVSDKIERAYATDNSGVPSLVFADRLPDELQEVSYLESNGTEWINSGLTTSANSGTECKYQTEIAWTQIKETESQVFGADFNSFFGLMANSVAYRNGWDKAGNIEAVIGQFQNVEWVCDGQGGITLNVDGIQDSRRTDGNTQRRIVLWGMGTPGAPAWLAYAKIKYFNVSQGGVLVRNFIPCYIKTGKTFVDEKGVTCSAGTPGLYDLVNGVFYTNSGTGTFSVGEDV